jgi:hypothetical protein
MGEAHRKTRLFTNQSILPQKRYHDRNATEKQFEIDDRVLAFILQRKIGKSPQRMNFCYGPYAIVEKHTNLTYQVQKLGEKKTMIIHVDRLRHYGSQRLRFESNTLVNELKNCKKQYS